MLGEMKRRMERNEKVEADRGRKECKTEREGENVPTVNIYNYYYLGNVYRMPSGTAENEQ